MIDHKDALRTAEQIPVWKYSKPAMVNLAAAYLELRELARPFAALTLTESEIAQDKEYATGRPIFIRGGALITVRDILSLRAAIGEKT